MTPVSPRLFVRGTVSAAAIVALASSPVLALSLADLSGGYDVLVKQNAQFNDVHIHGATAVGGNLTLSGGMSEFLNDNVVRPAGLSVGGSIAQNADARINNSGKLHVSSLVPGQSVVPGALTSGGRNLYFTSGQSAAQVVVPQTIDMTAAFNNLDALAASLAGMSQTLSFNSFVSGSNFNITLGAGSAIGFDVMNITGAQLAAVQNLNFSHTAGFQQKLVINVDLSNYNGGAFIQNRNGNDEADNILWNFYGASTLLLQNQFVGSILAPDIHLQHSNNDIKGSVFVDSLTKTGGQVHVHSAKIDFPKPVPDAGSTGLLALLAFPLLLSFKRKG
jgi:choice-of-anchor A domain-containing protein